LAILLPLGVMAAPAGNGSLSFPELESQRGVLSTTGSAPHQTLLQDLSCKGQVAFLLAAEGAADAPGKSIGGPDNGGGVKWEDVKEAGKEVGDEDGNGDEEEANGEEEQEDKEGEEEEGGGGWDRLWDAPRLG